MSEQGFRGFFGGDDTRSIFAVDGVELETALFRYKNEHSDAELDGLLESRAAEGWRPICSKLFVVGRKHETDVEGLSVTFMRKEPSPTAVALDKAASRFLSYGQAMVSGERVVGKQAHDPRAEAELAGDPASSWLKDCLVEERTISFDEAGSQYAEEAAGRVMSAGTGLTVGAKAEALRPKAEERHWLAPGVVLGEDIDLQGDGKRSTLPRNPADAMATILRSAGMELDEEKVAAARAFCDEPPAYAACILRSGQGETEESTVNDFLADLDALTAALSPDTRLWLAERLRVAARKMEDPS